MILVTRASSGRGGAEQTTADLTLQVALGESRSSVLSLSSHAPARVPGDTAAARGPVTPVLVAPTCFRARRRS